MTAGDSDESNKSNLQSEASFPAGRYGNEADMGQCAVFLATNQYLNGQIIVPDGGATLTSPASI